MINKYRVWDSEKNEHIHDPVEYELRRLEANNSDQHSCPNLCESCSCNPDNPIIGFKDNERFIHEQFIGRLDKNGKEIYVGDKIKSYNEVVTVSWDDDYCGFKPFTVTSLDCSNCSAGWEGNECEVVGNVHTQ